jgi:hypothetical protein
MTISSWPMSAIHICSFGLPRIMILSTAINLCRSLTKIARSRTFHCKAARASSGRAEDCSISLPVERSSRPSDDLYQASGEVHPKSSLGVHEVVLPLRLR